MATYIQSTCDDCTDSVCASCDPSLQSTTIYERVWPSGLKYATAVKGGRICGNTRDYWTFTPATGLDFAHAFPIAVQVDECAYIEVDPSTTSGSSGTPTTGAYEKFYVECLSFESVLIGTIVILDGLNFPNSINETTKWWIPKDTFYMNFYVVENSNRLDIPSNACVAGSIFIGSSAWRYKLKITGP